MKFCLRDTAGSPERARWLHLARSGSQSQRAIWFILPARGASHIIKSINSAFDKGELSICQKRGIITLLPKKDKPTDVLNNLHPVTLLNVDYKIATKVVANRLAKVLPDIICPNETGYVKKRYIGENVRLS